MFRPSNGDVAPAKEDVSPVPEVSVVADEFEVQSSDENEAVVPAAQSVQEMVDLLKKASQVISPAQLWVNPDCGLKTRGWTETEASLRNMVQAAVLMRK